MSGNQLTRRSSQGGAIVAMALLLAISSARLLSAEKGPQAIKVSQKAPVGRRALAVEHSRANFHREVYQIN